MDGWVCRHCYSFSILLLVLKRGRIRRCQRGKEGVIAARGCRALQVSAQGRQIWYKSAQRKIQVPLEVWCVMGENPEASRQGRGKRRGCGGGVPLDLANGTKR